MASISRWTACGREFRVYRQATSIRATETGATATLPWVVFRGFVDDLNEEFRNARIALVPEEIGGGFKLKILDYIFSRVPVAAVEAALNGIPDQLKKQFIIESSIGELLTTIVAVVDDIDRLDVMENRAFELAEDLFDWDANGRRLLEALEFIAGNRSIKQSLLKSAQR